MKKKTKNLGRVALWTAHLTSHTCTNNTCVIKTMMFAQAGRRGSQCWVACWLHVIRFLKIMDHRKLSQGKAKKASFRGFGVSKYHWFGFDPRSSVENISRHLKKKRFCTAFMWWSIFISASLHSTGGSFNLKMLDLKSDFTNKASLNRLKTTL